MLHSSFALSMKEAQSVDLHPSSPKSLPTSMPSSATLKDIRLPRYPVLEVYVNDVDLLL